MLFIDDLSKIKALIQHNIELFRLHDYMSTYPQNEEVVKVSNNARFSNRREPWYTEINSLYSTIVIIREYMKRKGDSLDLLDQNFNFNDWHILSAREYNDQDEENLPIKLNTIIRRLRNSVGHGKFYIDMSSGYAPTYVCVFQDQKAGACSDKEKNFELKINGMKVPLFLEKLESAFKAKYP